MLDNPGRHSIRLSGFDYSAPGAYFVTICCHHHLHLFGSISDGVMVPNMAGSIVMQEWARTEIVRPCVCIDTSVVMPNHTHAIIIINDSGGWGNTSRGGTTATVGSIVGQLKSMVSRRMALECPRPATAPIKKMLVWQRNFYERIVRDEQELDRIRRYIESNPLRWGTH